MTGLAGWVPNAHALIVHLPIGLLAAAAAADLVALLRRRPGSAINVATALHVAGSAALAAAYLTGRGAAADVYTPDLAAPVVARHWTWALWCLVYFAALTAARVWCLGLGGPTSARLWRRGLGGPPPPPPGADAAAGGGNPPPGRPARLAFAAAGLAGLLLLAVTAELGGRLVYQYGVGVAATPTG